MRFVAVCFVFLGLAFYQLSGGKDFVSRADERQALAATQKPAIVTVPDRRSVRTSALRAERRSETLAPAAEPGLAAAVAVGTTSLFDPVEALPRQQNITLVSLADNPAFYAQPLETDPEFDPVASSVVAPAVAPAPATPPVNPDANAGQTVPVHLGTNPAEAAPEIRRVKGRAVNLRSGPGTTFGILTTLVRDTEIEVLDAPGNGWVQLRPVAGGPTGWMAEYLLTN